MPITANSPENRTALKTALKRLNESPGDQLLPDVKDPILHPETRSVWTTFSFIKRFEIRDLSQQDKNHPGRYKPCE